MTGSVRPREGNRHREYAQGVYSTGNVDEWVALSVRHDDDWRAVLDAIDRPDLRDDPRFASAAARREHHDEFDEVLANWTCERTAEGVVATFGRHGVPAERLLTADRMYDVEQLDARGFYQDLDHSITGRQRFPRLAFSHLAGTHTPAQGRRADTRAAQRRGAWSAGLSAQEIAALREQRVIGERVLNA